MTDTDTPLWQPSAQRMADANLSAFIARYRPGADYAQLYGWSVAAVWECQLRKPAALEKRLARCA